MTLFTHPFRAATPLFALMGYLGWILISVDSGYAQRARSSGVSEAVRELEQVESRVRGGVYQVPLPEPASTLPVRALNAEEEKPRGIDIVPQEEVGDKVSPALTEIAASVAEIQARTTEVRARILTLQDEMASRLDDVSYARISLVVKAPLPALTSQANEAAVSTISQARQWPLAVHELSATLNDVPLVDRHSPRRLEKDAQFPLYEGPLPAGEHTLRLRLVVGLLASGWPSQLAQGRWLVEETFQVKHAPSRTSGGTLATVSLVPSEGGARPQLALELTEAKK